MYILNSVISDFLKDLSEVLKEYKVAIEVDENNNLQFVSYEHDFMVTASRFSEGTFEQFKHVRWKFDCGGIKK